MAEASIGIIGGSGLYQMAGLQGDGQVELETPFGPPSAPYRLGRVAGRAVAFLPRHGTLHTLSPTRINYRANIYGFKALGVTRILSASAVGSMREEIVPQDIVLPDQFLDRTRHRADTFFDEGVVAHVSLADPLCAELRAICRDAAAGVPVRVHPEGTYLCMEGPQFSTRAESLLYRTWGVSVIGMTNLTEARLAREAEICYVTLALVTDFDCWRDGAAVDVEEILENLRHNAAHAGEILRRAVGALPDARACRCGDALADAILTRPEGISQATRRRLQLLIGHRLPPS